MSEIQEYYVQPLADAPQDQVEESLLAFKESNPPADDNHVHGHQTTGSPTVNESTQSVSKAQTTVCTSPIDSVLEHNSSEDANYATSWCSAGSLPPHIHPAELDNIEVQSSIDPDPSIPMTPQGPRTFAAAARRDFFGVAKPHIGAVIITRELLTAVEDFLEESLGVFIVGKSFDIALEQALKY